jgi:hypothetical protein
MPPYPALPVPSGLGMGGNSERRRLVFEAGLPWPPGNLRDMGNLASRLFVGGLKEYVEAMHGFTPALHGLWIGALALIFWKQNQARRAFAGIVAGGYVLLATMPFLWVTYRIHAKTGGTMYEQDLGALKLLLYHCLLGTGVCVLIALLWLHEALRPRNDYTFGDVPQWRWWVMPLFLWAVWYPLTPDFPAHRELGFEGLLLSPFGIMPGATSLAILSLLAVCKSASRMLAIGMSLLVAVLTLFVEPRWWVGIPQVVLAGYCLAFWGGTWVVAGRKAPHPPGP